MVQLISNPLVIKLRSMLAEIGIGLLFGWWLLFLLEFIRAGSVSLYLDLNLVLVLGIVAFFLGKTDLKQPKLYTQLELLISGILIVWLVIVSI